MAPFYRLGQKSRVSVEELRQSLLIFQDRFIFKMLAQRLGRGGEGDLRKWILPDPRVTLELARQDRTLHSYRNGRRARRSGKVVSFV